VIPAGGGEAGALSGKAAAAQNVETAAGADKPNFVVVMVDDQSHNTFRRGVMPKTFQHVLDDDGTRFGNAIAVPPLCCPARAGLQTGQYPHNHGVGSNNYGLLRDKDNILPAWLQRAGYRTGLVGKYMNLYDEHRGAEPAPGFDYWRVSVKRPQYFDVPVSFNGQVYTESKYFTVATNDYAVDFLRTTPKGQPFFLWIAHYAPHGHNHNRKETCGYFTPQALKKDYKTYRRAQMPLPANFNEANVSDKPVDKIRKAKRINRETRELLNERYRCTLAALQPVDRGINRVVKEIKKRGEWNRTVFVYLSDNGLFFGEHRQEKGKGLPYREVVEVPFMMRVPRQVLGMRALSKTPALVSNIDLAPTFLELAGAEPCVSASRCRVMDGRSLVPVLRGEDNFAGRTMLIEQGPEHCYGWQSAWTAKAAYTEHFKRTANGGCRFVGKEYYDFTRDPYQLHNELAGKSGQRGNKKAANGKKSKKAKGKKKAKKNRRKRQRAKAKAKRAKKQVKKRTGSAGVPGADELRQRLQELRGCSGVAGRDNTAHPCD